MINQKVSNILKMIPPLFETEFDLLPVNIEQEWGCSVSTLRKIFVKPAEDSVGPSYDPYS